MSHTPTPLHTLSVSYGLPITHSVRLPLPISELHTQGLAGDATSPQEGQGSGGAPQELLKKLLGLLSTEQTPPQPPAPRAHLVSDLAVRALSPPTTTSPAAPTPAPPTPAPPTPAKVSLPAGFEGWHMTCERPQGAHGDQVDLLIYAALPIRGLRLNDEATVRGEDPLTPLTPEGEEGSPLDPLCLQFTLTPGARAVALRDDGRGIIVGCDESETLEVALTQAHRPLTALSDELKALALKRSPAALTSATAQLEALGDLWRSPLSEALRGEVRDALDDLGLWSELCTQGALARCEHLTRALRELDELDELDEHTDQGALVDALTQVVEGRERLAWALSVEEALDLDTPTRAAVEALDDGARALLSSRVNDLAWRHLPRLGVRVTSPHQGASEWWRLL